VAGAPHHPDPSRGCRLPLPPRRAGAGASRPARPLFGRDKPQPDLLAWHQTPFHDEDLLDDGHNRRAVFLQSDGGRVLAFREFAPYRTAFYFGALGSQCFARQSLVGRCGDGDAGTAGLDPPLADAQRFLDQRQHRAIVRVVGPFRPHRTLHPDGATTAPLLVRSLPH
jgi:hypothetical protein